MGMNTKSLFWSHKISLVGCDGLGIKRLWRDLKVLLICLLTASYLFESLQLDDKADGEPKPGVFLNKTDIGEVFMVTRPIHDCLPTILLWLQ
jgi:hypothetical protein